jgi:deazaflavin-dependent oxidoreductase (nitroreductase family)
MADIDRNDPNRSVIEEFRANQGRVGGRFEGRPMVLLHTTGARTGREHVTPVMYLPHGDRVVIFATRGGGPKNPAWYHNLVANPAVTIEIGPETRPATARVAVSEERDALYAEQVKAFPQFGEYEKRTTRTIPVVVLEP